MSINGLQKYFTGRKFLPPEAVGHVGKRTISLHAVEALIGSAVTQRTESFSVGSDFNIIKGGGVEVGREFLAPTVPSRFEGAPVMLLHCCEHLPYSRGVVVAAHQGYAGDFPLVLFGKVDEHVGIKRFAHVAQQYGTVATWTAVGTKREVDGKRNLVGEFLEDDVVGEVFEHLMEEENPDGALPLFIGGERHADK